MKKLLFSLFLLAFIVTLFSGLKWLMEGNWPTVAELSSPLVSSLGLLFILWISDLYHNDFRSPENEIQMELSTEVFHQIQETRFLRLGGGESVVLEEKGDKLIGLSPWNLKTLHSKIEITFLRTDSSKPIAKIETRSHFWLPVFDMGYNQQLLRTVQKSLA
jgi:hypothetical protein